MARNSKYVEAAVAVLQELGGGPLPSKVLIQAIVDKGLLPDRKYLYNNVLKKIRESALFDTSQRGFVSLVKPQEQPAPHVPVAPNVAVLPGQGPLAKAAGETF